MGDSLVRERMTHELTHIMAQVVIIAAVLLALLALASEDVSEGT